MPKKYDKDFKPYPTFKADPDKVKALHENAAAHHKGQKPPTKSKTAKD